MLPDLWDSLRNPSAYRRFAAESAGRSARYLAFLALVFIGALAITLKLRLAPLLNETFDWLATRMPRLEFSHGKLTSDAPGPVRLAHPRASGLAIMIDTTRKEPVTSAVMKEAKVAVYVTGSAVYLEKMLPTPNTELQVLDLSKAAAERPMTIDASTYREMERAFNWVFYPAFTLLFYLLFATSIAFFGLVYAGLGWMIASLGGRGSPGLGSLYRIALHAQTAAALLRSLDMVLPFQIPSSGLLSFALSAAYMWIGVRSVAQPPPAAPAPVA